MVAKTDPGVRFWRKVVKQSDDRCWPWVGHKSPKGYGVFELITKRPRPSGATVLAHRYAWMLSNGPVPDEKEICHTCDNRACCNPHHLYAGTHQQNMADMVTRGRQAFPKGERHGEHKLNDKAVLAIRSMYRPGVVSQPQLARLFGVSKRLIHMVIHREAWKHLP